jgi:hypothetical protein
MLLPTPRRLAASWLDLRTFLATRERTEWLFAGISIGITVFIIFAFWHDSRAEPAEQIVYVQSWPANRTDAEIIADQKKDRIVKKQEEAERNQALAERQASYQRLQKATAGWL